MKIYNGDQEVYKSGHINSNGLNPMRFSLLENKKFDVVFSLILNDSPPSISYNVTSEGEITFTFENPDQLDYGFSTPVKIGIIDDRELSVIFRVCIHGEVTSSYSLNYTFFLKVEK